MRPLLAAFVALLASACQRQPDVIFLTIDTLRRDHLGVYNPDSPALTPNMDALAGDSVRFDSAWSPISVTGPAFCTLHTGKDPGSHEVVINLFRGGTSLVEEHDTLAERLQDAGYSTGAFVSGFTLRKELGLDQGFERYDHPPKALARRRGARTADRAMTWMWKSRGPLFLWYHTYDAHGPWDRWDTVPVDRKWKRGGPDFKPIPRYQRIENISDSEFYEARYAASVEHTDLVIGRLVDSLKQDGRYDNALIVLTADHGESFRERELHYDHGTTPFVEQLSVPMLVKLPGNDRAGEVVDHLVGLRDVAPTVLDLLGLPALEGIDGQGLFAGGVHLLQGESSHCKKSEVLGCWPTGVRGKMVAARGSRFTLLRRPLERGASRWELYDRSSDPQELDPILSEANHPVELKSSILELWMARQRLTIELPEADSDEEGAPEVEVDEETQALRELGYLE